MAISLEWDGVAIDAAVASAAETGLSAAADVLAARSNARAPRETGTMVGTGLPYVDGPKAVVSYNTPYAARQHEELDWNHPNGGEAKFLEKATNDFPGEFQQIVTTAIAGALN